MKLQHTLLGATILSAGLALATAAAADCASELESLAGAPKGGAAAPLADSATPQTGGGEAAEGGDDMAKDAGKAGNLMPMGDNPDVATSSQDAQAQSQGGKTAAAQAMGEGGGSGDENARAAAIEEARSALAAGDEDRCMEQVHKAQGMGM